MVYAATKGTVAPAYVSPFVGRLADIGQNGVDLVANIQRIYEEGDGHALVLAASIRLLAHLLCCFSIGADLATVSTKVLRQWAQAGFPMPDERFSYTPAGTRINYQDLDIDQPWQSFNSEHVLTTTGIEEFAADYPATLYSKAS